MYVPRRGLLGRRSQAHQVGVVLIVRGAEDKSGEGLVLYGHP